MTAFYRILNQNIDAVNNEQEEISMKKTVIVAGATGLVGGHVCEQLQKNEAIGHVFALTRGESYNDGKIRWIHTDYENLALLDEIILAYHALICCLGTTIKKAGSQEKFRRVDVEYPKMLGDWAKSRKCGHYLLVSSTGADKNSLFFYSRCKAEAEELILETKFDSTTIVRPSLLLGNRNEFRVGEEIGKLLGFITPKSIGPVNASDVAKTLVSKVIEGKSGAEIIESKDILR